MVAAGAILASAGAVAGTPRAAAPAQGFVCPERMADDAARFAAMQLYMKRAAATAPHATASERLASYDRQLAKHRCAERTDHYTFPQE